jgi:formate hydrogenlyase subunit 3/multisubunit Na+/H+ antiporter MnhD subunit
MPLFFAYLSVAAALASGLACFAINRHIKFTRLEGLVDQFLPQIKRPITQLLADKHLSRYFRHSHFTLLGFSGVSAILAGLWTLLTGTVVADTLPFGLPWLSWHLRIDPLSGFFLCVLGLPLVAVSLYGPGYVREFQHGKHPMSVLGLFTGLFVAGMELVLLADDAFLFMIAWEVMSVASYFLVAFQHDHAANRRAAFLYLLMAEIGAIAIILAYGVLAGFGNGLTFDALRGAPLSPLWATIAFVLGLVGFGMKAGLVPIHAWLPEAHPVAPSHISALMSGVMLKIAVYGFNGKAFTALLRHVSGLYARHVPGAYHQ